MDPTSNSHQTDLPEEDRSPEPDNVAIGAQIRAVRTELGLTQSEFGKLVGYSRSVVANSENGRDISKPLVDAISEKSEGFKPYAASFTRAQRERIGARRHEEDDLVGEMFLARSASVAAISGEWFALWQTTLDGQEVMNVEEISIEGLRRNRIRISNRSVSPENTQGGYLWTSECRYFDNQYILGTYIAVEKSVRSKGVLQLSLHRSGKFLEGQWAGCNYDFDYAHGLVVMARHVSDLEPRMARHRTNVRSSLQ